MNSQHARAPSTRHAGQWPRVLLFWLPLFGMLAKTGSDRRVWLAIGVWVAFWLLIDHDWRAHWELLCRSTTALVVCALMVVAIVVIANAPVGVALFYAGPISLLFLGRHH